MLLSASTKENTVKSKKKLFEDLAEEDEEIVFEGRKEATESGRKKKIKYKKKENSSMGRFQLKKVSSEMNENTRDDAGKMEVLGLGISPRSRKIGKSDNTLTRKKNLGLYVGQMKSLFEGAVQPNSRNQVSSKLNKTNPLVVQDQLNLLRPAKGPRM